MNWRRKSKSDWGRLDLNFKNLSEVSDYVNERVKVENLTVENYISTENMLPNKGGIDKAIKLPAAKTTSLYSKGDILLSNIRTYFKKIWYTEKDGGCSNDVLVVRARGEIEPKFLYYVLSNDKFFEYSSATSKGTKMPRGDKSAIMQYQIPDMPLEEQRTIVSVLSALDDRIAENKKINHHLAEMAESIWKEKYANLKPNSTLGNFFPIITGKKDANVARGGQYPFFSCSQGISYTDAYSFEGNAILLAGNGDFNVITYNGKFEAYQRTYVLIPNNEYRLGFLYYAIKHFLSDITAGDRGSVIKYITKGDIENLNLYMPDDESDFELFNQFVSNTAQNNAEIERLTETRDTLLPKLMSGELSVID